MSSIAKPQKPRRRWLAWLIRGGICCVILLTLLVISAPYSVGWVMGKTLQSQLSTRMQARLEFDRVIYKFPYGIRINKAHLLMPKATSGPDSWIDIGRLELRLAKLPIGVGPLVIERLEIENPTVRLVSDFGATTESKPVSVETSTPTQKLSDLFRLQSVTMTGGRFEYDLSAHGRQLPPVIWDHLDANINTRPTDVSNYQFGFSLNDKPLATVNASGQFDIDSLMLDLDHLNVGAACDSKEQAAQLPPAVQEVIRKFKISGRVGLEATAHLPLRDFTQAKFSSTLSLKDGECTPPGWLESIKPAQAVLTCKNRGEFYDIQLTADDGNTAAMQLAGSYKVKTMLLDVATYRVSARLDSPQLPPAIVQWTKKNNASGRLAVSGSARVPLNQPKNAVYFSAVDLRDGERQPPGWKGPITSAAVSFTASNVPGGEKALVDKIPATYIPDHPAPSHIWLENVSAECGKQNLKIEPGGEITFDTGDKRWAVRKVHGVVDVGDGPGPLDGAHVRVWLPFIAAGNGKIGDDSSAIRIALDGGAARVAPQRILIDAVNGVLIVTPVGLSSTGLTATCALGKINTAINLGWNATPNVALNYAGEFHVSDLDLHQLAMQYTTDPIKRQQAFGNLNLNTGLHGTILKNTPDLGGNSAADRLVASGDFDINHGYFLALPILKDVLTAMNNPGASVAGEAAATFEISHQVINLTQVAVSSPAIGVQGNGTVGFDQKLNMMFVAAPLSDWSKDLKGTGIGVLQGLSDFAGQAQNLVNKAQSVVLYQFRVTGNFDKPVVKAVPVPILSDSVGPLFDKMSSNHAEGSMSEELKKEQK